MQGEPDMELIDRADGAKGHFCIRRIKDDAHGLGTAEYYNHGKWCAFGQVFTSDEIIAKLMSGEPDGPISKKN